MSRPVDPDHSTSLLGLVRLGSRLGIARGFRGLYLAGEPAVRLGKDGHPLLFCPNHSNWWDGFVAALVHKEVCPGARFGLLQEEEHLEKYPLFRKAGVLGLDLRSPRAAVGGMRRALAFLASSSSVGLWVFPQGVLLGAAEPSIVCRPGASYLARQASARVVPVGIRYAWMRESKPTIFVRLGEPLENPSPEVLGDAIDGLLEEIDSDSRREDFSSYRRLVGGGISLQHLWEGLWGGREKW